MFDEWWGPYERDYAHTVLEHLRDHPDSKKVIIPDSQSLVYERETCLQNGWPNLSDEPRYWCEDPTKRVIWKGGKLFMKCGSLSMDEGLEIPLFHFISWKWGWGATQKYAQKRDWKSEWYVSSHDQRTHVAYRYVGSKVMPRSYPRFVLAVPPLTDASIDPGCFVLTHGGLYRCVGRKGGYGGTGKKQPERCARPGLSSRLDS